MTVFGGREVLDAGRIQELQLFDHGARAQVDGFANTENDLRWRVSPTLISDKSESDIFPRFCRKKWSDVADIMSGNDDFLAW